MYKILSTANRKFPKFNGKILFVNLPFSILILIFLFKMKNCQKRAILKLKLKLKVSLEIYHACKLSVGMFPLIFVGDTCENLFI
jgi:hypothetical protein